jgi:hypothetical protein
MHGNPQVVKSPLALRSLELKNRDSKYSSSRRTPKKRQLSLIVATFVESMGGAVEIYHLCAATVEESMAN